MLKWFEWQTQFHQIDDTIVHPDRHNSYISCNLFKETQFLRDWIKEENFSKYQKLALSDQYVSMIAEDYEEYGVTLDQLKSWFNDDRFTKLMKESGTSTIINLPDRMVSEMEQQIGDRLPIIWQGADIAMTVQNPGDMFPLHRDRIKFKDFVNSTPEDEISITRYLIMLFDQRPGQVFQMGNDSLSWKAGDTVTWPHHFFQHHGSANFGFWPRVSVRITAKVKNPNV